MVSLDFEVSHLATSLHAADITPFQQASPAVTPPFSCNRSKPLGASRARLDLNAAAPSRFEHGSMATSVRNFTCLELAVPAGTLRTERVPRRATGTGLHASPPCSTSQLGRRVTAGALRRPRGVIP